MGDALLIRVAARLRDSLRASDPLARLGGDEFAVLVEYGDPVAVAESVIRALAEPFRLGERAVGVSASIGGATAEAGPGQPGGGAPAAAPPPHPAGPAPYPAQGAGQG